MQETGLIRYDAMVRAIAEAHSVDEVKDIRDKALALERYAAQAMNTDAERKACEIRLRAEVKAGEMLSEMDKSKGAAEPRTQIGATPSRDGRASKLSDIGISYNQSSRWQKLASVPKDVFEAALSDPNEKPSTNGIIRKANGDTSSKMHPDALWLWGRLRDFEKMDIAGNDVSMIAGEMTEAMQADMRRIIPIVVGWLTTMEGVL